MIADLFFVEAASDARPQPVEIDQAYTARFRDAYKRTARALYEMALCAAEVRNRYSYPAYIAWLDDNFGLSRQYGDNLLNIQQLLVTLNFSVEDTERFSSTALQLLAAPSTPAAARHEAIERAADGEDITWSLSKAIVEGHKAQQPSTVPLQLPGGEPESTQAASADRSTLPNTATDQPPTNQPVPRSKQDDYDSDAWYTPAEWIARVRAVLGEIDLDPASSDFANVAVGAAQYFTKADDGLRHDWHGRVFVNPPYSRQLVDRFATRLIAQYEAGITTEAILLVNKASDTRWQSALLEKYPVCFPRGRINFERPDYPDAPGNSYFQALFYMGRNVRRFYEVFSEVGPVLPPGRLFRAAFALDEVQP